MGSTMAHVRSVRRETFSPEHVLAHRYIARIGNNNIDSAALPLEDLQ